MHSTLFAEIIQVVGSGDSLGGGRLFSTVTCINAITFGRHCCDLMQLLEKYCLFA